MITSLAKIHFSMKMCLMVRTARHVVDAGSRISVCLAKKVPIDRSCVNSFEQWLQEYKLIMKTESSETNTEVVVKEILTNLPDSDEPEIMIMEELQKLEKDKNTSTFIRAVWMMIKNLFYFRGDVSSNRPTFIKTVWKMFKDLFYYRGDFSDNKNNKMPEEEQVIDSEKQISEVLEEVHEEALEIASALDKEFEFPTNEKSAEKPNSTPETVF